MGLITKIAIGAATTVAKDVAKNVSKNISNNASNSINDAINSKINKGDTASATSIQKPVVKEKKPRKKSRTSYKCDFNMGLSQGEFTQIVNNTLLSNPKIAKVIEINPPKIKARAKKGLMGYEFSVDYNDYGKITGAYWITTDSSDKTIAIEVAEEIKKAIEALYLDKDIDISSLKEEQDSVNVFDVPPEQTNFKKSEYNVVINKKTMGPFDLVLFEQMVSLGQITCDSLVWKKGMKEWTRADEVDELKQFFIDADEMPPLPF